MYYLRMHPKQESFNPDTNVPVGATYVHYCLLKYFICSCVTVQVFIHLFDPNT